MGSSIEDPYFDSVSSLLMGFEGVRWTEGSELPHLSSIV